jgi:hypothetical protein
MAIISNAHLFAFAFFKAGTDKAVGNNRRVLHVAGEHSDKIIGTLHGHPVFCLSRHKEGGKYTLTLDTCGYLTTTTVAAIKDFLFAAGLCGRVSRAGGEFKAALLIDGGRGGACPMFPEGSTQLVAPLDEKSLRSFAAA